MRNCSLCKGPRFFKAYCVHCLKVLKEQALPIQTLSQNHYALESLCLFHWGSQKQWMHRQLLYQLKGGRAKKEYTYWANSMFNKLQLHRSYQDAVVVYPQSTQNPRDHAHHLAYGLAANIKHCRVLGLVKVQQHQQKYLSVQAREELQFTAPETAVGVKPVIFVDDIITSGGTAMAAWRALGRPKNFIVCTVVERSLLLGP